MSSSNSAKRGGRIFESPWFWIAFFTLAFGVPLYRSLHRPQLTPPPVLGRMKPFQLKDYQGENFSSDRISGIVSVFTFIDPTCREECRPELENLDRIQKSLKGAGPTAKLVTLNTKPETVNPTQFGDFIKTLGPQSKMWIFVTGEAGEIHALVADNMGLGREAEDLPSLAKNGTIVLVDQVGQIRAVHHLTDSQAINKAVLDIAVMINTNPPRPATR